MPNKRRANIEHNQARRELYVHAAERVKEAIAAKYYLEAITLLESLISDRLESYIEKETQQPGELLSLGINIKRAKACAKASSIPESVELLPYLEQARTWKNARNELLHEAVKIEEGAEKQWDWMTNKANQAALEGCELFKNLKRVVSKLKNRQLKQSDQTL